MRKLRQSSSIGAGMCREPSPAAFAHLRTLPIASPSIPPRCSSRRRQRKPRRLWENEATPRKSLSGDFTAWLAMAGQGRHDGPRSGGMQWCRWGRARGTAAPGGCRHKGTTPRRGAGRRAEPPPAPLREMPVPHPGAPGVPRVPTPGVLGDPPEGWRRGSPRPCPGGSRRGRGMLQWAGMGAGAEGSGAGPGTGDGDADGDGDGDADGDRGRRRWVAPGPGPGR